jgi:hypothetical protein
MDAAPIILTAKMGASDQSWANALRRAHYPSHRNHVDAHITLFHHLPPGQLPEIKSRVAAMAKQYAPPQAWLSDVMLQSRGVAYRVDSPELIAIREELAQAFWGLLIAQDHGIPNLHITIQNKVESNIAKALYRDLSAIFEPRYISIMGLSAYYYRGGSWEPIQSWSFRG